MLASDANRVSNIDFGVEALVPLRVIHIVLTELIERQFLVVYSCEWILVFRLGKN